MPIICIKYGEKYTMKCIVMHSDIDKVHNMKMNVNTSFSVWLFKISVMHLLGCQEVSDIREHFT